MALTTRRIGLCQRRSRKSSRNEQNIGSPDAITNYFELTLADNGDSDEIRASTKVNTFCDLTLMSPDQRQRYERLRGSSVSHGEISKAGGTLFTPIPGYANESPRANGMKSQRAVEYDFNFNTTSIVDYSETDEDTKKETYMRNRMEVIRHYIGEMVYHNEVFIEGLFLLVFLMTVVYIYLIERSFSW